MPTFALTAPSGRLVRGFLMALLCCFAIAPTSATASGEAVLRDCVDGTLKPSYSVADYREALEDMPTDLAEYTDCASQIRAGRDRAIASLQAAGSPYVGRSKATTLPPVRGAGTTATVDSAGGAAGAQAGGVGPQATTPPADQVGPTNDETSDAGFLALPVGGGGDGASTGPDRTSLPLIPIVIALSVIALTAARGLVAWSRRPERLDPDTSVGTA